MSDVLVSVRIPAELNDRLVSVAGSRGRSKFIRMAIEAGLHGEGAVPADRTETGERVRVPKKKSTARENVQTAQIVQKPRNGNSRNGLSPDADFLMAHLLKRPRSERDVGKDIGWLSGRVSKAARELGAAGLMRYSNSLMVVHLG